MIGNQIHPQSARILESFGADTSAFAARQLTPKIAATPDLLLTMTRAQRDAVLALAPRQLHRTFTLAEAAELCNGLGASNLEELTLLRPQLCADGLPDICDPIGERAEFFAEISTQIAELLLPVLRLCKPE